VRKKTIGAAALVFAFSISVASLAVDGKRYAGSYCKFADGDTGWKSRHPSKFQNGAGSTLRAVCPVVQDGIDGDIEYVEVIANAEVDEDTCYVSERRQDGSAGSWTHEDVVEASEGYNKTRWGVGAGYLNTAAGAAFSIACDLPNGSLILMYRVDEP